MSKKAQKRRGPRPARQRAAAEAVPTTSARRRPTPIVLVGLAGGSIAIVLLAVAGVAALTSGRSPSASPTPSPPAAAVASSSPRPAASGSPTTPPGGPVAEALVAALHADPFRAHVDESVLARRVSGTTALNLTARATGDISGRDVAIHATGTGGGPATDQELVSVGDVAWTRAAGAPAWTVQPRSDVASEIDGLLATIALIDDPTELVDLGVETVDGQSVHHLSARGDVPDPSGAGSGGVYETLDVWATGAGIPVAMSGTFSSSQGADSITGSTEIHYTKVGGPIAIAPPDGAPTLAP